jgi:hypothetical protein
MPQPSEQQTARYIRAIYNYQIGHPAALAKFILLGFVLLTVVCFVLGVASFIFSALGL